jgi:hypothetical protein
VPGAGPNVAALCVVASASERESICCDDGQGRALTLPALSSSMPRQGGEEGPSYPSGCSVSSTKPNDGKQPPTDDDDHGRTDGGPSGGVVQRGGAGMPQRMSGAIPTGNTGTATNRELRSIANEFVCCVGGGW